VVCAWSHAGRCRNEAAFAKLAGVAPIPASSMPAPPSAVRPGVPAELDRIVLRLLSKAAEDRYAAAEELVLDLRDFLNRAA